jgi:hypothetical protein
MPPVVQPQAEDASELTFRTWRFLEEEMTQLGMPLLSPVMPIQDFRKLGERKRTTAEEREAIVEQGRLLLEHLYPHLPFKRDIFSFIPQADLFEKARGAVHQRSEIAFHQSMLDVFALVRDAHTTYGLPPPFTGALAFLPFQLACFMDNSQKPHFIVASVMSAKPAGRSRAAGLGHKLFGPGAIIVSWSGLPIEQHIIRAANTVPGGNVAAFYRRGAMACTTRMLAYSPFPFEDETPIAEIVYRPSAAGVGGGPEQVIRLPWGVARFPARPELPTRTFSISFVTAELNNAVQRLHDRESLRQEQSLNESADPSVVSTIPEVFEFQFTGGPRRQHPIDLSLLADSQNPDLLLGYLRIKSFNDGGEPSGMTERLVREARRILTLLDHKAPHGLVIDIRGNPGGDIEAAERILQMLTPVRIAPEEFHLANTEAIVGLLRSIQAFAKRKKLSQADAQKLASARLEFEPWLEDAVRIPFPKGPDRLTSGRTLTDPEKANEIGQVYQGRVVLLVDASTYSAAEIFAAGFEDHAIGPILSVDSATGGGGASVSNHGDLLANFGPRPGIPLAPLPAGIFMRIAFRRCVRVGPNAGKAIEDFGVNIGKPYFSNLVDDALAGFPSLLTKAAELIGRTLTAFRIDVPAFRIEDDGSIRVDVMATNTEEVRYFLDGRRVMPVASGKEKPAAVILRPPRGMSDPARLRLEGYSSADLPAGSASRLVCVRNIDLQSAPAGPAGRPRTGNQKPQAQLRRRRRR